MMSSDCRIAGLSTFKVRFLVEYSGVVENSDEISKFFGVGDEFTTRSL